MNFLSQLHFLRPLWLLMLIPCVLCLTPALASTTGFRGME